MSVLKFFPFEFFNGGFSGALLLLFSVVLRLWVFRPRLRVSFDPDSEDFQRFVESHDLISGKVNALQSWIRLRIENKGLLKLTNPRILCAEIVSKPAGNSIRQSVTPFELAWSESHEDGLMSVLFPGRFEYRFDLAWLTWGAPDANHPPKILDVQSAFPARKDRAVKHQLITGIEHEILLLIANDNILVPSHFVRLQFSAHVLDLSRVPTEEGLKVNVKITAQGDWWWGGWKRA